MSTNHTLDRLFARYPVLAVLGYGAIVAVLGLVIFGEISEIYDRSVALAAATDMLDRLEGRRVGKDGDLRSASASRF